MKKNIFLAMAVSAMMLTTSCGDSFLEVNNPTGEPLEEYYTTEETLEEALMSAYSPLHWPDWDGTAYNDLTVDAEIQVSPTTSTGTSSSTSRATATTPLPHFGQTSIQASSVATTSSSIAPGVVHQKNTVKNVRLRPACCEYITIIYCGIIMAMCLSISRILSCHTQRLS